MSDKSVWADEIAGELERARLHMEAASKLARENGFRGYATAIEKEIERVKAIEWPLRGRHPDDRGPPGG